MIRALYHVDAFTNVPFAGNAAAVVPDARGLSDDRMQAIAREMNLSETVFAFPPEGPGHDLSVRFFSPTAEVPLCGHATVALHHVRAVELGEPCGRTVQKTKAGLVPVETIREGGLVRVSFAMRNIEFCEVMGREERARILAALGAAPDDLDGRCPMQRVYSGVMIGLKNAACLNNLSPDMKALASLSRELGFDDFVPFTLEAVEPGITTQVRVFAPAMGIDEDPVTGSANGPLAAYLVKHRLVEWEGEEFRFLSRQGTAIGRPGIVHLCVKIRDGEPAEVSVGGDAVVVFRTQIEA